MSSHLLHKDADGIGMVWDRYGRDSVRQSAAKLGQSARVVSDPLRDYGCFLCFVHVNSQRGQFKRLMNDILSRYLPSSRRLV